MRRRPMTGSAQARPSGFQQLQNRIHLTAPREDLGPTAYILFDPPPEPPHLWKPLYIPVEWAIDETPLVFPLLWWADVWGVGSGIGSQATDSVWRGT